MKKVAIVGLGYVGLPLALVCAQKGHEVMGIDTDENKISSITQGKSPIHDEFVEETLPTVQFEATTEFEKLSEYDTIIIAVPTPVQQDHTPDLTPLLSATKAIIPHFKENALIIIESTIAPGTTHNNIEPLLKQSNKTYLLAHCPERIDPGNKHFTLTNIPRVLSGTTQEATEKAKAFYETIIEAPVTPLSGVKEVEATKMVENTFRDINIAFMNEIAMSFDKAGIDTLEVIKGASTKPFAFIPHYPGVGVGGHCIPVDPYYLIRSGKENGFDHKFVALARAINESMPHYTLEKLETRTNVGVYGLAYKADIDDTRESPGQQLIALLKEKGITPQVYDPYAKNENTVSSLGELLQKSDALIITTDHSEIKHLNPQEFKEHNIKEIIDGKNCLNKHAIKELGITYKGIGQS